MIKWQLPLPLRKKVTLVSKHFLAQPTSYLGIIGLSLVLLVIVALQVKPFLHLTSPETVKKINVTVDGFSPSQVSIKIGDTVEFTTSRTKPFWPASDLHPTHTIYPEFDPRHPIDSGSSWSFRFDKAGTWKFHDHLSPEFTGFVVVTDSNSSSGIIKLPTDKNCQNLDETQAVECWFSLVDSSVRSQGIDNTYDMMASLFKTNEVFAKNCHAYTHRIGQIGYSFFSQHKDFSLGQKTAFCGYGFYHGFMEALLEKGENYEQAKSFCDLATTQLSATARDAGMACYHGIGHGFADYFDPVVYHNPSDIANRTLALCKKIADNDQKLFRCGSGVFNALALDMGYGKLPVNKEDPLSLCREQTGVFKDACYGDMQVLVLDILSKQDFSQASKFIEAVVDDTDANNAIEVMSADRTKWVLSKSEYSDEVASCRKLQNRLIHSCIIGLAAGLMEFGEPGQEYSKALFLCSETISENEKDGCHKRVLNYSANIYTPEKLKQICLTVNEKYQAYCRR